MSKRFGGENGRRRIIEILEKCYLVKHNKDLAEKLFDAGTITTFKDGDFFIKESEEDNDVFFILLGEAEVTIKGKHIAIRKPFEVVGEMAAVEPSSKRSATLKAIDDLVTLKVEESEFTKICDEFPQIYKAIAEVGFERLRQRSAFIPEGNTEPVLFIGCSTESLEIAREIQSQLQHDNFVIAEIWTDGIFSASGTTIDDLQKAAERADFGAFIFHPDDLVISRKKQYKAPRDNTIFELGLFMGKFDRNRNMIIYEHGKDVKVPSDLLGITPITYSIKPGASLTNAIAPVCHGIRKKVKTIGVK